MTMLTVFQGYAGDRNELAISGAAALAASLSQKLNLSVSTIGTPAVIKDISSGWRTALNSALPDLLALSAHYENILSKGGGLLTVLPRCAAALATLPIVARYHPDACVVWFDAHADLNTPETSASGYLGGMAISGPAGLWESGLGGDLKIENVILTGSRDIDPGELELIDASDVKVIPPGDDLPSAMLKAINGRAVYIHLDCDVLNPGIVPSEYQVTGGLSLQELHAACLSLSSCKVLGIEIAEFQNHWGINELPVSPDSLIQAIEPILSVFRTTSA